MNKPHPHAELMLQYAKDAAETDKPWERWEVLGTDGHWKPLPMTALWTEDRQYRRKPNTTPIRYTVSCNVPIHAPNPEAAAQAFRRRVADGTLLVTMTDVDGLVHVNYGAAVGTGGDR
jgi:hypothetical protein